MSQILTDICGGSVSIYEIPIVAAQILEKIPPDLGNDLADPINDPGDAGNDLLGLETFMIEPALNRLISAQ